MNIKHTAQALLLLAFLCFNGSIICGQTAATTRSTTAAKQPQWEYLVVSFGKVYFADPLTDPDRKASGDSKLISFSREGIVIASEGISTQRAMDTLGRFGWELVGAVGAIGGDQEMLFKRPFDENRSKQEEELIKKEGERIRNLLQEERTKTAAVSTAELVDLDEAERVEARNTNRRNQEQRLRTAAETFKDYPLTIDSVVSDAYTANDTGASISITVDATSKLLTDGNKFRSGEAKKLADSIAASIARAAGVSSRSSYGSDSSINYLIGKVKIEVKTAVNFNGKKRIVGTARTGGDW